MTIDDALPPQNLEAELSVIGSMLLDNEVIDDIAAFLRPVDFYRDTHTILCQAIFDIRARGCPVDALILIEHLTRSNQLGKAGGERTIVDALERCPHAANAKYHAQIVKQRATARSLIEACLETVLESHSNLFSSDELSTKAEARFRGISDSNGKGETGELSEAVDGAIDTMGRRGRGEVFGVSSGFKDVDRLTDGFQAGTLTIIAGRPSMGKTAYVLNVCEHNVRSRTGVTPYIVSLEMGEVELAMRLIQASSPVDGNKLKHPRFLNSDERRGIDSAQNMLKACSFPIDAASTRTISQVAANARRLKARRGIGLLVVDYLQLLEGENSRDNRQEQISKITRRLKTLAGELAIPVIALSQLNRKAEDRDNRRPRMADLRESGSIEQDADVVLLVHRPEYYEPNDQPGVAEIIIAKNRNGPIDTVRLAFHKAFARFDSLSTY